LINTKFTPEENLKKANEFLDSLRKNEEITVPRYNREYNLPQNICYYFDKRGKPEPYGYKVSVIHNGKAHTKTFCKLGMTMEQKYELALKHKEELLKRLT